ncbi:MAG TPA: helix-turn-helix transcriptional regulator, partial [Solirubrobacterales bacterium]|nr:helix-turn-helix transcriptional regulator [Solirubrobacterales bacterium]
MAIAPRERFAQNLVVARRASGLTQDELANRCKLHRTEISLLERAGREPRLGTLVKLAGSLGVSVESLAAGVRWDEKAQKFKYRR